MERRRDGWWLGGVEKVHGHASGGRRRRLLFRTAATLAGRVCRPTAVPASSGLNHHRLSPKPAQTTRNPVCTSNMVSPPAYGHARTLFRLVLIG